MIIFHRLFFDDICMHACLTIQNIILSMIQTPTTCNDPNCASQRETLYNHAIQYYSTTKTYTPSLNRKLMIGIGEPRATSSRWWGTGFSSFIPPGCNIDPDHTIPQSRKMKSIFCKSGIFHHHSTPQ